MKITFFSMKWFEVLRGDIERRGGSGDSLTGKGKKPKKKTFSKKKNRDSTRRPLPQVSRSLPGGRTRSIIENTKSQQRGPLEG